MRKLESAIFMIFICLGGCVSNSNDETESGSKGDFTESGIIQLKKPSGQYGIGTLSLVWSDSTREEISTPSREDIRQLHVQIWYPSALDHTGMLAPYLGTNQHVDQFRELVGDEWYERLKKVRSNAILNSQVSDQRVKYPVVIFSPGFGASSYFYSLLTEELASHGFIVVAVDHPYLNPLIDQNGHAIDPTNNYWHSFPAAGAAVSYEDGLQRVQIAHDYFSADHIFVHERLKELNRTDERFKDKIDLGNIASVGHSAGTMAPMGLMSRKGDPFKAYILYDVNIHNYIGGENIIIPNTIETEAPVYLFILEYAMVPPDEYVKQMKGDLHITRMSNMSHIGLADFNFILSKEENNKQEIEKITNDLDNLFSSTIQFLKVKLE